MRGVEIASLMFAMTACAIRRVRQLTMQIGVGGHLIADIRVTGHTQRCLIGSQWLVAGAALTFEIRMGAETAQRQAWLRFGRHRPRIESQPTLYPDPSRQDR